MAHLTLAGVSDDGRRLRLVDAEGVEHTVDVDERLRAALRGDATRRLETKMDSALRPRDIQARIRAGETPEAVAQAAQTSVDKIMAFAAPVLAERQHVAERAQRSSVRRTDGSQAAGGARTLGDAAATHLRSANVDPDKVEWDAWRREDGRWSLTATYSSPERSGTAELTFDAPGNYVTLDNEDARWLVGEAVAVAPTAHDDLRHARQRRLGAVGELDQELPLGEDATCSSGWGRTRSSCSPSSRCRGCSTTPRPPTRRSRPRRPGCARRPPRRRPRTTCTATRHRTKATGSTTTSRRAAER